MKVYSAATEIRQRGSHKQFRDSAGRCTTIPFHQGRDISPILLRQIAKDKLTDAEITLDRTPNTSLKYMDALRNMKYQEVIYEILVKQFEMAKLDEAKDAPLTQVLFHFSFKQEIIRRAGHTRR